MPPSLTENVAPTVAVGTVPLGPFHSTAKDVTKDSPAGMSFASAVGATIG
jgi:hypothetical protein